MSAAAFWLARGPLLLASGSAARRAMLEAAGLPVEIEKAELDERAVEAKLPPGRSGGEAVATALAQAKALSVSARRPGRIVLGADQTLDCGGRLFHKPSGRDEAVAQLLALSGRSHVLTSAFCLACDGVAVAASAARAVLTMRGFSPGFVRGYLDAVGEDVLHSVGCYRIEGPGAQLFERVEGDHFTILGLPLFDLLAALRRQGWLAA